MECDKAEAFMMQYMDRTLSEKDAKLLNAHLKMCSSCKADFYAYEKMMSEFNIQKIYSPADGFAESVMREISSLDFKRPTPGGDVLFCILLGAFSALFGLGLVTAAYKDAIAGYLAESGNFPVFLKSLGPVARYVSDFTSEIVSVTVSSASYIASFVSPFRYVLLFIFVLLALAQYLLKVRPRFNLK